MVHRRKLRLLVGAWAILLLPCTKTDAGELGVQPASIVLTGPEASQQLVTTLLSADGESSDVTRVVSYEVSQPTVATIDQRGLVRPLAEGQTEITIRHNDHQLVVPVDVQGLQTPAPVSFSHDA